MDISLQKLLHNELNFEKARCTADPDKYITELAHGYLKERIRRTATMMCSIAEIELDEIGIDKEKVEVEKETEQLTDYQKAFYTSNPEKKTFRMRIADWLSGLFHSRRQEQETKPKQDAAEAETESKPEPENEKEDTAESKETPQEIINKYKPVAANPDKYYMRSAYAIIIRLLIECCIHYLYELNAEVSEPNIIHLMEDENRFSDGSPDILYRYESVKEAIQYHCIEKDIYTAVRRICMGYAFFINDQGLAEVFEIN